MSVESMAIVLHHSPSSGTDKVVLLGIANHDGDGGAWPSIATLAKYANVAERNVQSAIKRLEASGQITRHFQDGGTRAMRNGQRPNRYVINLRCPAECDRSTNHKVPTGVPADRGDASITPDASITRRGDAGITGTGDASITQTIHEPSPEPSDGAALRAATDSPVETSSSSIASGDARDRDTAAAAKSSVGGGSGAATRAVTAPAAILEAMTLTPDEAARFRAWLVIATNATNPDGLIVTLHTSGRLPERLTQWRASDGPAAAAKAAHGATTASTGAAQMRWCGRCDQDTRMATVTDHDGRELLRRCPTCNIHAGRPAPGAGAAQAIAQQVQLAAANSTEDGRAAFLAARAALPAGARRRVTTIGEPATAAGR
jgi:hypothetical protein